MATDPMRLAEDVIVLGVVPVGTGTFTDMSTGALYCSWPGLIERPVRALVQNLGSYGADQLLVEQAQPALTRDLLFRMR